MTLRINNGEGAQEVSTLVVDIGKERTFIAVKLKATRRLTGTLQNFHKPWYDFKPELFLPSSTCSLKGGRER